MLRSAFLDRRARGRSVLLLLACWALPAPADPELPHASERGYLGVSLTEICPEVRAQTSLRAGEGLMIGRVAPGSPAAALGLLHYDILTAFNDQRIMSPGQFVTLVENTGPGVEVEITYLRRSAELKAKVKLERAPAAPLSTSSVTPLPEEMLSAVIRTLRDHPAALQAVHQMLHGVGPSAAEGPAEGVLRPGARFVLRDEEGELELTLVGGLQQVRAWNREGALLFEGPCHTEEAQAALPPELKPRLQRLQREARIAPRHPAAAAEKNASNRPDPPP